MSKPNFNGIVNSIKATVSKHSPEILTGIGIAGMVTTTVLAVKATPKALSLVEDRKYEMWDKGDIAHAEEAVVPPIEVIKITWKCYIPAVVTCAASVACLIGASSVNLKRNAALATAYKLSEKALVEYKDAALETLGEKKEKQIRDKMSENQIKANPVGKNEVIITGKGSTLCYDAISGQYFHSDMDAIKRAENALNKQLLNEMYVSLNDFYSLVNVNCTSMGDDLGWKLDDGLIELYFSSQISEDGTPCLVVNYDRPPKYGYSSFE